MPARNSVPHAASTTSDLQHLTPERHEDLGDFVLVYTKEVPAERPFLGTVPFQSLGRSPPFQTA